MKRAHRFRAPALKGADGMWVERTGAVVRVWMNGCDRVRQWCAAWGRRSFVPCQVSRPRPRCWLGRGVDPFEQWELGRVCGVGVGWLCRWRS